MATQTGTANDLNIHIKILTQPTRFTINQMVEAMTDIYKTIGISVKVLSSETLDVSPGSGLSPLNRIEAGGCAMNGSSSTEQELLSQHRNNAHSKDVVVYFCSSV